MVVLVSEIMESMSNGLDFDSFFPFRFRFFLDLG